MYTNWGTPKISCISIMLFGTEQLLRNQTAPNGKGAKIVKTII